MIPRFLLPAIAETEAAIADQDSKSSAISPLAIQIHNFGARRLLHAESTRQYDLVARVVVCLKGQAQTLQDPRIRIKL